MSTEGHIDDYWTQSVVKPASALKTYLNVEKICGVSPLDAQFGVASPKSVPDALYEPVFGCLRGAVSYTHLTLPTTPYV